VAPIATLVPANPKAVCIPAMVVCPVPPLLSATVPEIELELIFEVALFTNAVVAN
jgi:hypothetical protein